MVSFWEKHLVTILGDCINEEERRITRNKANGSNLVQVPKENILFICNNAPPVIYLGTLQTCMHAFSICRWKQNKTMIVYAVHMHVNRWWCLNNRIRNHLKYLPGEDQKQSISSCLGGTNLATRLQKLVRGGTIFVHFLTPKLKTTHDKVLLCISFVSRLIICVQINQTKLLFFL